MTSDLLSDLQRALGAAYRIERELGGGGMSRVFVADETALGRKVVLKVLPPELRAGLNIDRFRREIQLAASLHHPNIVPVLTAGEADAGSSGGLLYYTMPLIEGDSLRTRLARMGELPVGEVIRLLRDVVDALACAHEHGVVHRDIKPDNVLLSRNHALVTDFGVAKALSEATGRNSLTSAGVALGTPAYMAPEQATADPHVDHRADLYAVGALAYEMLAGRPPFVAPTPQAVLAAQVTQAVEPVSRFRPSTPPALAALVMRCLEKRPADRWQSADELLHQLESMATPSGGMAPTAPTPAVPAGARSAPEGGVNRQRAGYLVLGLVLALAVAWAVSRHRGVGAGEGGGARSVVVLPFENLGRPDDEYFADGITEEITNHLTGIGGLRVVARSSARSYKQSPKPVKQIGQELGVDYVLEGTVRWERAGDTAGRVRVSPGLIRVSDGTNVWGHGYDAAMAGVFQMQSDIAEQVARALDVALAAPERTSIERQPTSSAEAYDYYLRARGYLRREYTEPALRTAEDLLARAVALDSSFALAWAYLARTHDNLYWFYFDRSDARREQVKQAAERAIALQPDLPDGYVSLGYYFYHGFLDYDRALAALDQARRLRPDDSELLAAIGYVKRRQGKLEEALAALSEAARLDQRSVLILKESAWTATGLKRLDEAERLMERARILAPEDVLPGCTLATLALMKGDTAAARRHLSEALVRSVPQRAIPEMYATGEFKALYSVRLDSTLSRILHRPALTDFGGDSAAYFEWQALVYRLEDRATEMRAYADSARAILETRVAGRPDDAFFHGRLGLAWAMLGREREALGAARRALELRPPAKDAWAGPEFVLNLADVNMLLGHRDAAVEQLRALLRQSGEVPVNPTSLRFDRRFTALQDHPGFRELLLK